MAAPRRKFPGQGPLPRPGADRRMPALGGAGRRGTISNPFKPDTNTGDEILKSTWADRGFDSKAASQSVNKQYGLMMQPNGQWGKPTMSQFTDRMETAGYGPQFQANSMNEAGTPVSIGGARWMMGKNGLNFTGQASDYGNGGGNAYNAATQVPYGQPPPRPAGGDIRRPDLPMGGGGGGGGNRGGGNRPNGNQPGGGQGRPNQGNNQQQTTVSQPGANFPGAQQAPPAFLPATPQFEAGSRGLNDQYQANMMQLTNQRDLIKPQFDQQMARMDTNQLYDVNKMKESLAGRGVYTPYGPTSTSSNPQTMTGPLEAGGGVGSYLNTRDIQIPYGRQRSDMGTAAMQQYGDIAQQLSGQNLAYNQGMAELLLNRASDAASAMPMNVPQYSMGNRILPGRRNTKKTTVKKPGRRGRRGGK